MSKRPTKMFRIEFHWYLNVLLQRAAVFSSQVLSLCSCRMCLHRGSQSKPDLQCSSILCCWGQGQRLWKIHCWDCEMMHSSRHSAPNFSQQLQPILPFILFQWESFLLQKGCASQDQSLQVPSRLFHQFSYPSWPFFVPTLSIFLPLPKFQRTIGLVWDDYQIELEH